MQRCISPYRLRYELRANPNQPRDEKGRWCKNSVSASHSSLTKSVTGGTIDLNKRKEGHNADSTGRLYIPFDSKDNPYRHPEYYLPPKEYKRVTSGISTYYSKHAGKVMSEYNNTKHRYQFENHGFGEYNIFSKEKNRSKRR